MFAALTDGLFWALPGYWAGAKAGSSQTPVITTTPVVAKTPATPLPVINRLATSPWPRYRGNARNTGRGTGFGAVGLAKWQFGVNPPGTVYDAPPTVGSPATYGISTSASIGPDGTLYFGAHNLYAVDRVTGVEKWHVASDDGYGVGSAPAVSADGTVYVGVGNKFCALDGATGRKKWEFAAYGGSPPAIGDNGLVYFGRDKLYACDSLTGAKKWEYDPALAHPNQDAAIGSPTLGADGTVYAITGTLTGGGTICAFDGATGAKKDFARGIGFLGSAAPVIGDDGTIYLGAGGVIALDGVTGAQKWRFDRVYPIYSAPAVGTDGTLYAVAVGNTVLAINGATGAQKWKVTLFDTISSHAEVTVDASNTVYVGSQQGTVYALNGATGGIKWQYAAPNSGAVTTGVTIDGDGTLYAGFADGTLRAIR